MVCTPIGVSTAADSVLRAGFLFSTIGITASDFFCPNLATVADRLGLGESTAGVTFLAFGNGSPDVFSTFSALKSNTFALAIGELLGASAFITSIVVGSMALIQPFHVPRWPFLRDVGFFTVAVTILVACLKDGKLTLPETGGLVFLYILYVGIVVGGNWWHSRRKSVQERQGKGFSLPEEEGEPLTADTRPSAQDDLLKPTDALLASRSRSSSVTSQLSLPGMPTTLSHQSTGTLTPHRPLHRPPIDAPRPTFSLLGAIEFRDAINALRKESAAAAATEQGRQLVDDHEAQLSGQLDDLLGEPSIMADYFGPSSPFPSGHYHSHGHHLSHGRASSRPGTSRRPSSTGRMRDVSTPGALVVPKPDAASRVESTPLLAVNEAGRTRQARTISDVRRASADAIHSLRHFPGKDALPEPTVQDAVSPTTGSISDVEHDGIPLINSAVAPSAGPSARPQPRWVHVLRQILHTLFPALQEFRQKSISGKILGIFASPAILALTVTLPVVDDSAEGLTLEQGGAIRLDDHDAAAGDAPYQGQNEAEHGIVNHSNDADAEDEQQVMGLAGHDLHRRLLAPGNMSPGGSPVLEASQGKYDQDAQEECTESDRDEVLLFNKYLTATQAVLGTLFCSCVIFCKSDLCFRYPSTSNRYSIAAENAAGKYIIPALTAAGACLGLAILFTARDGMDPTWRLIRCFAGFFSAMLWIAAIADEVVEILQVGSVGMLPKHV